MLYRHEYINVCRNKLLVRTPVRFFNLLSYYKTVEHKYNKNLSKSLIRAHTNTTSFPYPQLPATGWIEPAEQDPGHTPTPPETPSSRSTKQCAPVNGSNENTKS